MNNILCKEKVFIENENFQIFKILITKYSI